MKTLWGQRHLSAVPVCSFSGKLTNLGQPGKHNAAKPNNAWWRWIRSGQRNPPVITKTAHMQCDHLFKIAHLSVFSN
jgi:hypothetical protein